MSLSLHEITTAPLAFHGGSDAWYLALDTAYGRAKDAVPAESRRIDAGYRLIAKGGLVMRKTHASVDSQSAPGKTYVVADECQCSWFTWGRQEGQRRRCAHRWAYLLYSKAIELLTTMWAATYTTTDDAGVHNQEYGFATALPEDGGFLFTDTATGHLRFLSVLNRDLVRHGKCAWYEDGVLCGMLPQALLDMQPK